MKHIQHVRILYKSILRIHRGLPKELQALGNNYVRDEFKRHKKCSEDEARLFMTEWTDYAINLATQLRSEKNHQNIEKPNLGKHLEPHMLDDFRDEQVAQLYELMKASKKESPETK